MKNFLIKYWGSVFMVYNGKLINMLDINHIIHYDEEKKNGLLCYYQEEKCFHIVSLNSTEPNRGIGSALLERLNKIALTHNVEYFQVETTNDNIKAIGFYQKNGFDLFSLKINEVDNQRVLKPEIPFIGYNGIPIRHILQFRKLVY